MIVLNTHEHYMNYCLELAQKGAGNVSPNPMVGSVLVYDDKIIGQGYHEKYGEAHAEVNCINSVKRQNRAFIKDSILYVSLEPCSHFGKTPPCVEFILANKIPKVVVACKDISAKVNGKGIEKLKMNGVDVVENILEQEAIEINKRFFTFHQKKRPYIILKWAESTEGYIGCKDERVKLSSEAADKIVHQWRAEEDAIWVGYNTASVDNPKLNVRLVEGRNPIRIVYDRDLTLDSKHFLFDSSQQTFIFNKKRKDESGKNRWIQIHEENYLFEILNYLYTQNILSVIIEGGSKLSQQFIDANLWDEARQIQTSTSLSQGIVSPVLKNHKETEHTRLEADKIIFYINTTLHP